MRRSRHEELKKVELGSEALYGGRGDSKDILGLFEEVSGEAASICEGEMEVLNWGMSWREVGV
jgi:hypothetical protein